MAEDIRLAWLFCSGIACSVCDQRPNSTAHLSLVKMASDPSEST